MVEVLFFLVQYYVDVVLTLASTLDALVVERRMWVCIRIMEGGQPAYYCPSDDYVWEGGRYEQ